MAAAFSVLTAAKWFSHNLVACNVYVSAGQPHHAPLLLQLLQEAQDHCTRLQHQHQHHNHQDDPLIKSKKGTMDPPDDSKICMVHAYADGPYNRSSFHLAGTPSNVAAVASQLATNAAQALLTLEEQQHQQQRNQPPSGLPSAESMTTTRHPTVGLVDHIAVMPLPSSTASIQSSSRSDVLEPSWGLDEILSAGLLPPNLAELVIRQQQQPPPPPNHKNQELDVVRSTVASGWVARAIGYFLQDQVVGTQVLFYGQAHPQKTPLATIRRESTRFFQLSSNEEHPPMKRQQHQATAGAPHQFVENYNIRLSHRCSYSQAKTLTQWVRARDGGLLGVEALTLPYSQNRWEVACNLLQPHVVGAAEVAQRVKEWEVFVQQQQQQQSFKDHDTNDENWEGLVEVGYRVGTTVAQCWTALDETTTGSDLQRDAYNQGVRDRFQEFLSLGIQQPPPQ
jgi:Formiminotransferase domain, N-terminal subdomain